MKRFAIRKSYFYVSFLKEVCYGQPVAVPANWKVFLVFETIFTCKKVSYEVLNNAVTFKYSKILTAISELIFSF